MTENSLMTETELEFQDLVQMKNAAKHYGNAATSSASFTSSQNIDDEYQQHVEEVHNNINIFLTWADQVTNAPNLHELFIENFDVQYRIDLFENINEFFNDTTFISDRILFYWKLLVIDIIKHSKKYSNRYDDLTVDVVNLTSNLRLVREKHIFRCFLDNEPICYFKENGTDYYVS